MSHPKRLLKTACAIGMALLLSGCVIVPCCGDGYYHHRHYWGD